MYNKKTIVLTAGGTGGHFFPSVAVAEELARSGYNIHLITDLRCEKYITKNMPIIPHVFNLHLNMSSFIGKVISIYKLIIVSFKNIALLLKLKPAIVIGFGGYPSFPTMIAAIVLRLPIVIQEQNRFLGKSNRIFIKQSTLIALSYENTSNIAARYKNKVIYTGNIIRTSIQILPEKQSFDSEIFNLLILGGSQGAFIFSHIIPNTIQILKKSHPNILIKITQQVSQEYQPTILKIYQELGIECRLQSFFENIDDIYKNTDLVISRSGAGTIAELTSIGLPAIFIPLPEAVEDHQTFNAITLVNNNASWCYQQKDVTPQILADKLYKLITNRKLLRQASQELLKTKTNGTKYFANIIVQLVEYP